MALFAKQMDVIVTQVQILYSPPRRRASLVRHKADKRKSPSFTPTNTACKHGEQFSGQWHSWLAQTLDKRQVEGSSPSCPTNTLLLMNSRLYYIHIWAVSDNGSTSRLHREGESSILSRSTKFDCLENTCVARLVRRGSEIRSRHRSCTEVVILKERVAPPIRYDRQLHELSKLRRE